MSRRPTLISLLAAIALAALLGACSSDSDSDAASSPSPSATESASESPDEMMEAPSGSQGSSQATFSPSGPYSGGETVTVSWSGFRPNEAVNVTICAGDGRPLAGPQSCAPLGGESSKLVNADADGAGTTDIVVITGPLGNTEPPALTCGPENPGACAFTVTDLSATNLVVEPIEYQ